MDQSQRQLILDLLANQQLGVISTVNAHGQPESAVLAMCETDELALIFGTYNDTRKYHNLMANSAVAVVIHNGKQQIQYEGEARELIGDEAEAGRAKQLVKTPASAKFASDPRQRYFLITPRWIRYVDISPQTPDFEISF